VVDTCKLDVTVKYCTNSEAKYQYERDFQKIWRKIESEENPLALNKELLSIFGI